MTPPGQHTRASNDLRRYSPPNSPLAYEATVGATTGPASDYATSASSISTNSSTSERMRASSLGRGSCSTLCFHCLSSVARLPYAAPSTAWQRSAPSPLLNWKAFASMTGVVYSLTERLVHAAQVRTDRVTLLVGPIDNRSQIKEGVREIKDCLPFGRLFVSSLLEVRIDERLRNRCVFCRDATTFASGDLKRIHRQREPMRSDGAQERANPVGGLTLRPPQLRCVGPREEQFAPLAQRVQEAITSRLVASGKLDNGPVVEIHAVAIGRDLRNARRLAILDGEPDAHLDSRFSVAGW